MSDEHLPESVLAAYVDQALTPDERRRADVHLDACAPCRAALVDIMRLADGYETSLGGAALETDVPPRAAVVAARRASRWPRRVAVGGALAAGLAAILVASREPGARRDGARPLPDTAPVERATPSGGTDGRIAVVGPAEGEAAARRRLVFTWRAAPADLYRVTLLTGSGEPVWSGETSDTALALPDSVALAPGRAYFWRVDGIAEGLALSSGARQLRVR